MRELYRQDLLQLGNELERMASGVTRAIERASRALHDGDLTLAEQTIDADARLDDTARSIDDMCVTLLALQGPVASDLRLIVSALRLSQTMEREGDLARHIAMIARSTYPIQSISDDAAHLVNKMCDAAVEMAHLQEKLIIEHDLSVAANIQSKDDILDDLQAEVRRMILEESEKFSTQQVIDLTLATRFLERFGDHTVSVSRRVVFIVEGEMAAEQSEFGVDGRL